MITNENWRSVVGYEGLYEISDCGNVRSLDRVDNLGRCRAGKVRSLNIVRPRDSVPYAHVMLSSNGERRVKKVHHLVLEAFVGRRLEGFQACHNNGNSLDNRPSNLRWDTSQANHSDKKLHGTVMTGDRNHKFVLSPGLIDRIRDLFACGLKRGQVSQWLGVSRASVWRAMRYGGPSA